MENKNNFINNFEQYQEALYMLDDLNSRMKSFENEKEELSKAIEEYLSKSQEKNNELSSNNVEMIKRLEEMNSKYTSEKDKVGLKNMNKLLKAFFKWTDEHSDDAPKRCRLKINKTWDSWYFITAQCMVETKNIESKYIYCCGNRDSIVDAIGDCCYAVTLSVEGADTKWVLKDCSAKKIDGERFVIYFKDYDTAKENIYFI